MGRTLLGIDLDESPVGGLIERLLSEEELEKLTDGGRDPDEHADASGDGTGGSAADASDDGPAETDASAGGTDIVDDAVESGDDGDPTTVPVGTSDQNSDAPWDTGSPSAASTGPNETAPTAGAPAAHGTEDESDNEGDWKAKLRPLLLKATLALTVLAVVALVLYRYLGTATEVAGDKLPTDRFGGDDEGDADAAAPSADDAVSPARRRARVTGRDQTDDAADADRREDPSDREEYSTRSVDEAVHDAEDATDEGTTRGRGPDAVGRQPDDSDVGALVGLAALALVAAVVRKFGEDRPRDPLVDGPADDYGDE